jgi:DNA-binding response OmpR family regulator
MPETPKARILTVDDDPAIHAMVQETLGQFGYEILTAKSASAASAVLKRGPVDIILLDVNMPGVSGLFFLRTLRNTPETSLVPVILLTAQGDEAHKVIGFRSGADDYVVKPFSALELESRIGAILRRSRQAAEPPASPTVLEAGGVRMDIEKREVSVSGQRPNLTPSEFLLLEAFLRRPGHVLTFSGLEEALSSQGSEAMSSATIYVHVKNLRKKLGERGDAIETVHGVGYRFDPRD